MLRFSSEQKRKERRMNKIIAGLTIVVGLGFSGFTIAPSSNGFGTIETVGTSAALAQWDERRCRRLRRACEFKDERGERGEGNCRRYRRECSRWWR
jgi:hypothetical protein